TPTVVHFDALGRTVVAIAYNRFVRDGVAIEERNATRIDLDLKGNARAITDPQQRTVVRYDYDVLGRRIHQASMDAGERWMLHDVSGKPVLAWDSRGIRRRLVYDALRRPTHLYVTEDGLERLFERTDYGEQQGDVRNHRTRVYQRRDAAGIITTEAYDF